MVLAAMVAKPPATKSDANDGLTLFSWGKALAVLRFSIVAGMPILHVGLRLGDESARTADECILMGKSPTVIRRILFANYIWKKSRLHERNS